MTTTTRARSEARKAFLHGVFTTALEGGINYWATVQVYKWSKAGDGFEGRVDDLDGFHATVTDAEDGDDATEYHVDIDVIAKGVGLFKKYCNGQIDYNGKAVDREVWAVQAIRADHYWKQFLLADRTNGEDGDYDAEVADQILQFGLFGKAVYG